MGLAALPGIVTEEVVMNQTGKVAEGNKVLRKAAKDG